MSSTDNKPLHWTQRVALVRHALHAASRSGDFTFFRILQAHSLLDGVNHAANLASQLGDDADIVMASMDNLNAGLAYVYQDAFKSVYDSLKDQIRESSDQTDHASQSSADVDEAFVDASEQRSLHVDMVSQKDKADMAIDKLSNSASTLIAQQPEGTVQDEAASVWITGAALVADAIEIALREMDHISTNHHDSTELEASWTTVKASVVCAVTGLKGVYHLMDQTDHSNSSRQASSSSASAINPAALATGRSNSIASVSSTVFRRLSNAFTGSTSPTSPSHKDTTSTPPLPPGTRTHSIAAPSTTTNPTPFHTPNPFFSFNSTNFTRNSSLASATSTSSSSGGGGEHLRRSHSAVLTNMPPPVSGAQHPQGVAFEHHKLCAIPPTPAAGTEDVDPFDTSVPGVPAVPAVPVGLGVTGVVEVL